MLTVSGEVLLGCNIEGIADDVYAMQMPYDTQPTETASEVINCNIRKAQCYNSSFWGSIGAY